MAYITPEEVLELTTSSRIQQMDTNSTGLKIFIAGAESIANGYHYNKTSEGFEETMKLGIVLLIDYLAYANVGGGALLSEEIGVNVMAYQMKSNGLKDKMAEFETIMGSYITGVSSSGGGKRIRMTKLYRKNGRGKNGW